MNLPQPPISSLDPWRRRTARTLAPGIALVQIADRVQRALLGVLLLVMMACLSAPAHAQSVSEGLGLYTTKTCSGCHGTPATAAVDHRFGSNAPQRIAAAIRGDYDLTANHIGPDGVQYAGIGGAMLGIGLTPQETLSLALYIGQVKLPSFTVANGNAALAITVRSGATGTKDIYPVMLANGGTTDDLTGGAASDSNGMTTGSPGIAGAASNWSVVGATSTMNYNAIYTSAAKTRGGTDSFSLTVNSAAGSSASRTIAVTVLGIDNATVTATAIKGQNYPSLYAATCNGCAANSFSVDPATPLPTGLSISSAGVISGIPSVTGVFNVTLRANSSGATDSGDGQVQRDITITVHGITNAPPSYTQGVAIASDYVIGLTTGATPTGVNPFNITPLPTGFAFDQATGHLNGTPTLSGSFPVTISANTSVGVLSQSATIAVVSAGAPVITSTPALSTNPASPTLIGTVGQPLSTISNIQINATNPPIDVNSYSATGLPSNVTAAAGSGLISGTPAAGQSGVFTVSLSASNNGGTVGTAGPFYVQVNPSTAPVVTNAAPPTGNVGTAYPAFSVTATNLPITTYALAAGSSLPSGLTLNAGSGAITGTPSASGQFKVSFTATNAAGTSAPVELTFNIISNLKPITSIPSPTSLLFGAGVLITPIQVVATNPVITAYKALNLPAGLQLDTATGIITGTPTTPGKYAVLLSADNGAPGPAFGPVASVDFNIGIPAPTACAMSVPLNTASTLDLATCLFGGFAPTGVTIIAAPAHGTVVTNGTRVTYTPVNNYFGTDIFTFVGSGMGGKSDEGRVTVTVTGRPDPAQDATVTALLGAQVDAAQRFSRAQISNYQRRTESLHSRPGPQGSAGTSLQGRIDQPVALGFTNSSLLNGNDAVDPKTPGGITALAANHNPAVARESDVVAALAAGAGVQSLPLAESVVSLVKNHSVNLSSVGSGLGLNANPATGSSGGVSYWVEGVATFGTRDAQGGFSSSEFSSDGITIGADKRYSDQLALGMGLGYARDKTVVGTDGSVNRSKGYSLAVYGSFQPTPTTFIDGLLGFGSLDFNSSRFVAPISDFAYGKRNGSQVFGALTGGYEWRQGNLLLSPYGRVDFSTSRLDTSTETGAGAYALRYVRQTSTSVEGALGVRAESIHAADFGYAVPRVRVEYRHEFKRSGDAFIQYADQAGGPLYRLPSAGGPRDSMVLGLGSDFILRDGLTLSIEYQLSHSFSNASTQALRLRLSKDFDVRGLPRLLSEDPEAAHDEPINVQLEAGAVYDDNVTRAKAGADRLGDHSYALNVGKAIRQPLSENSRLLWSGTLGGEKFRHYNGLSRVALTGEVEYQYRASSEFDEPTLGAFARLTGEAFESELRDGYRFSAGVSLRQPLTDRIGMFAALSHNRRYASSEVFSTVDNSIRGNLDYAIDDKQIVYLGAEYRKGDIVSTGRASLENVTVADVFAQDDAYPGGQMFSYRFRGATTLLTVGYNLGLGPRDSIDFSWRHIQSTPGLRPSFVTSPRSYKANQLSVVYLMRF